MWIKKIDNLESQNTNLKGENAILKNDIVLLKGENAKLKSDIVVLQNNNEFLNKIIEKLNSDVKTIKDYYEKHKINDEAEVKNEQKTDTNARINHNIEYQKRLKVLDSVFKGNSISINSMLNNEKELLLNKEVFEAIFICFEIILNEIIKINDGLLYQSIDSFIEGKQKDSKPIRTKIFEKTLEDDACSIYYRGIFNMLYGKERKMLKTLKNLMKIKNNILKKW